MSSLKQHPISYINSFIYEKRKREKNWKDKKIMLPLLWGKVQSKVGNPFDIFRQRAMLFFFSLKFMNRILKDWVVAYDCAFSKSDDSTSFSV